MAKFSSLDGTDKNGIRAEVIVQTGTGRISEIVGRGKQNDDGTYRNVEIVFDPDNPLLKRKVYGLLDTTAKDLWDYIQAAHADGRTIAYRIESQRRNGVDRTKKMADLNATEEIRRILAGIDGVFSHEAKTNPAEDPSNENPSALDQPVAAPAQAGAAMSPADSAAIGEILAAVRAGALAGSAAARPATAPAGATHVAAETDAAALWNTDGHVNLGSHAVARAAEAEQFALDHLIDLYTPAKAKTTIAVTDEIVAQAASLALTLLDLADQVQTAAYGGGRPDRQKPSHARALALVTDAVGKRHPAPIGGNDQAQTDWAAAVVAEASERLYGIGEVAQGRLPQPEADRVTVPADAPVPAAPAPVLDVAAAFDAAVLPDAPYTSTGWPSEDDPAFLAPDPDLIARLRDLCVTAQVDHDMKAVSDWIESCLGVRSARKVHAPALEAFVTHYEQAGPATVRTEVLHAPVPA